VTTRPWCWHLRFLHLMSFSSHQSPSKGCRINSCVSVTDTQDHPFYCWLWWFIWNWSFAMTFNEFCELVWIFCGLHNFCNRLHTFCWQICFTFMTTSQHANHYNMSGVFATFWFQNAWHFISDTKSYRCRCILSFHQWITLVPTNGLSADIAFLLPTQSIMLMFMHWYLLW